MTDLERFIACMDYRTAVRRPNHELGAWPLTRQRWGREAPEAVKDFSWQWFYGEDDLGLDRRDYIPVNFDFLPPFKEEVLEETDDYEIIRSRKGIVSKALKEGSIGAARSCMDQYIGFPVSAPDDFEALKSRLVAAEPGRYPDNLDDSLATWRRRDYPLALGRNCAARGFYWRARELMGTENLSLAWYDYPDMMHDMMSFFADFLIETSRPLLEKTDVEFFIINEDLAMKGGPLLSPETYATFILPHLKRLVAFLREHGVRYIALDSDGDPTVLVSMMMDAGVDTIWPVERAAGVSPQQWRRTFGRDLRLWGGVDKRVLARGPKAIRDHLKAFIPLIEEGGFIPTVDHTVPPDVSWDNFHYYMDAKRALLSGHYAMLEE